MTFDELKTEVVRRLEESSSSPVFFSASDIEDALNEAYMEMSDATEWYERWRTVDVLDTRPYYDVRTVFSEFEVLTPGAAFHDTTNRWLIPANAVDLDRGYVRWERVRGTAEFMLIRGLYWIGYWPIAGAEGDTIKQYVTALPPVLEDDDDEPGFAEVFHFGLVEHALAELLPQVGEVSAALTAWDAYLVYEANLAAKVASRGDVPLREGYGENAGATAR